VYNYVRITYSKLEAIYGFCMRGWYRILLCKFVKPYFTWKFFLLPWPADWDRESSTPLPDTHKRDDHIEHLVISMCSFNFHKEEEH